MKGESSHQDNAVESQKGKKPKRFLERNDAISLAASIGGAQEEIALSKAEKHHKVEPGQPDEPDRKPSSNSKAKLKATKAVLSAARVKAKKDRSKLRRERFKNAKNPSSGSNQPTPSEGPADRLVKPVRKVSFA
ncbi:hypothetical protein HYPSUDRAFT_48646 [Hypholoma sublateritium FD-334 SS-4]|uniref:Uncharacterized protein n=1 Tax=Hypholoma sublateritium (strain FD-334 SS-4) TaxID=945553 RepID=A0A0D2KKS3_HYPSF|nr:hypothetical protein HYPSUDRAFT_48646 [Hypholoma sublateritium FD-334 SS-4]